ncbi:MAG: superoxide dismutase [Candidatus Woesearchaeota archaeon]
MAHTLDPLPYKYDSLEPYIDKETMMIHHDKHHQSYVDKLNKALEEYGDLQKLGVGQLLCGLDKVPEKIKQAVINNGGGHINHTFFWQILKKDVHIKSGVCHAIEDEFGTLDKFMEKFKEAAMKRFGSGWAWLVLNKKKELEIVTTPNQDSPVSLGMIPLIALDVWEHAYYLKYKNKRDEYIDAFLNIINWEKVDEIYQKNKK